MQEKLKIAGEIEFVKNLKMLVQAYEEISVIKMQRVRGMVLKTRDFLTDLAEVFLHVRNSYRKQIEFLLKKNRKKNIYNFSTVSKNGKSVAILLSANTKLYGDIVRKVFNSFTEDIRKQETDIVIMGKLGKELFDHTNLGKKYEYFEISDTGIDSKALEKVISYLSSYEKVTVYYGKFVNVIDQDPVFSSISGEDFFGKNKKEEKNLNKNEKEEKFIFEPSLEKILNFFETQIFSSLFRQTIHESELARNASRIKAMELALDNISMRDKELKVKERRVRHLYLNNKQIEVMSGISLWRKN